jgi:hypothetical protein
VTVSTAAVTASSNTAAVAVVTQTTATTATTTAPVVETETTETTDVEVEVPVIVTTTFTIQLSYGNLVVVVTDTDGTIELQASEGSPAGTLISSNSGAINDLILPQVGRATGGGGTRALTPAELGQIRAGILTLQAGVVVVPNNPIFVSPSS